MHPQIISKWIDKEMLLNENISAENTELAVRGKINNAKDYEGLQFFS